MQLRITSLKSINSAILIIAVLCAAPFAIAQEIIEEEEKVAEIQAPQQNGDKIKADGVAAVVGDYIVLDSDVSRRIAQIKAQGGDLGNTTDCELFGSILEEKLYAHQAIQDSITVNELQIRSQIDQQIQAFLAETNGSIDELLKLYGKETEDDLRESMYDINKNMSLAGQMREKVVSDVEITPEEVRQFYNELKTEGLPTFGTELKVANIVVIPEVTEDARKATIEQLKGFRKDILENGASFTTKVLFYTDDAASKSTGGRYTLHRKRPRMVKEFRDVAFSLQEGDISEPFKTDFGYHIIQLEKVRGQEYDVRHILRRPEITNEAIEKAKEKIEEVRAKIIDGTISFEDAAREFSDEKETKFEGGKLINPQTQDFNFELTKMDPDIYAQIQDLKDGEVSKIIQDEDRVNPVKFKIMKVSDRIDEHEADFARDYLKIKRLALQNKHFDAIGKWQEDTIMDTYIKINGGYRKCDFNGNWLKK